MTNKNYSLGVVVLLAMLSLLGCSGSNADSYNRTGTPEKTYTVFGFNYIPEVNKVSIFGKYLEDNIIQLAYSPNRKCIVYTKTVSGGTIDLYKMCSTDTSPGRITETDGIEFDPAINNEGDFAYAYHSYNVGQSDVYCNNKKLVLPVGLYGKLLFLDEKLVGHYARFYDDTNWLFEFNTSTDSQNKYLLDIVPDRVALSGQNQILLEGVLKNNGLATVGDFSLVNKEYQSLCQAPCAVDGSKPTLSFVKLNDLRTDEALQFFVNRALRDNDPLGSLSATNNDLGRLSWGVSYRLNGLLKLSISNTDIGLPLKIIIKNIVENLMSSARFDETHPGWPTKKYSISHNTQLSLLVDDAVILYPLLKAYNLGLVDADTGKKILNIAEKIFAHHEKNFDTATSFYHFEKNIDFTLDGVWLPFNQQNIFGSALVELYKATDKKIYKDRAVKLALAFKSEFVYLPDGRLIWHYWPSRFYAGWLESDNLSIHTPKQNPSTDTLFEDLSHASHNISFIEEFMSTFPNEVFIDADIQSLEKTLQAVRYDYKFSRFMSGDFAYQSPTLQFLPGFTWLSLGNEDLLKQYSYGAPSYYPYFDGDLFFSYVNALTTFYVSN